MNVWRACMAGSLKTIQQAAILQKIRRHKDRAVNNAKPMNKNQTSYMVRKFLEFQRQSGSADPQKQYAISNAIIFEDYVWWIQRCTNVRGPFKQARTFVKAAARHFGIRADPFEGMLKTDYEELKKAFDKEAVLVNKVNLPFSRESAAFVLNSLWDSTKANDDHLHSALLIHLVTSLRPGNILKGSSDPDRGLVLKMSNVYESKVSKSGLASMFILNDRQKNSKGKPVLTAVPFNDKTKCAYKECAATKLKAIYKRRKREGAKPHDCIFINVRSKGPLTTRIANTRIQQIMALKMQSDGKPESWKSFYTLKSARKAVASHMEHLGCAPQTVASQLKHASIQSQMSYICKFYKKKNHLIRALYKDL